MMTDKEIKSATRNQLADELAVAHEYTEDWETAEMDDLRDRAMNIPGRIRSKYIIIRRDAGGTAEVWNPQKQEWAKPYERLETLDAATYADSTNAVIEAAEIGGTVVEKDEFKS